MKRLNNRGFTIIELLIATIVFSVVLLLVTGAIIQFSKIYYKGTIQARTQETARTVLQEVSQAVQFSANDPVSVSVPDGDTKKGYLCAGGRSYTYVLNKQLGSGSDQAKHVMVSSSDGSCKAFEGMDQAALPLGSRELLGERMQLVDINIQQIGTTKLYQVSVHVVYGENGDLAADKKSCNLNIVGGQFCAVSYLTTTVVRRLGV